MSYLFLLGMAAAWQLGSRVRVVPRNELPICTQLLDGAKKWTVDEWFFASSPEAKKIKGQRIKHFCFPFEISFLLMHLIFMASVGFGFLLFFPGNKTFLFFMTFGIQSLVMIVTWYLVIGIFDLAMS